MGHVRVVPSSGSTQLCCHYSLSRLTLSRMRRVMCQRAKGSGWTNTPSPCHSVLNQGNLGIWFRSVVLGVIRLQVVGALGQRGGWPNYGALSGQAIRRRNSHAD